MKKFRYFTRNNTMCNSCD